MSEHIQFPTEPARPIGSLPTGTPPHSVVPSLYDRLSQSLQRADSAFARGDSTTRRRELELSSAMVFDLLATLNFRQGGELTPRLAALYAYFASEILNIGRTNNRETLGALIDMVGVLGNKWRDEVPIVTPDYVSPTAGEFAKV